MNCVWHVSFLSLIIIPETNYQSVSIALPGSVFKIILVYQYWVIFGNIGTSFQKEGVIYCNHYYYGYIHLTDIILITFYCVSMIKFFSGKKLINNTEEAPFGIPVVSTEPANVLRVKLIVEIKIGFMLEIERYSCD